MLGSEAVALIKQRLSFRTDLDAAILAALQEAQFEFEQASTLPWWLIAEDQTLTTVSGTATVALPTGWLAFVEDEMPYYYVTGEGKPQYLTRMPRDDAAVFHAEPYSATTDGRPLNFALRNSALELFPTPDAVYTLYWSYYKAADAITLDAANSWLTYNPYRLVGRAGMRVAADIEHESALTRLTDLYATWTTWQHRNEAMREASGMPRAMGSNR